MRIVTALALALVATPAPAQELKTDEDRTLYALGMVASRSLRDLELSPKELEVVKKGLTDALTGKRPQVDLPAYEPKVQELARKRMAASAEKNKEKSRSFLETAAREKGAQRTASGLVFLSLKDGAGDGPKATDTVKVNYEGKLTDGTVFDSSYKRGQPVEFPLDKVIPCWSEGLQKMKAGGKARLVCPSSIAYGDRGFPPTIPGGATLVFEVELLEIKK